jgi:hypothetical protein
MKHHAQLVLLIALLAFVIYSFNVVEEYYMNPYKNCPVCEACPMCKTCETCPPPPKCPPCLNNTQFEEQKGFVRGANTGAGVENNFFDAPCSANPRSDSRPNTPAFPLTYVVLLGLPIFLIYLLTSLVGSKI